MDQEAIAARVRERFGDRLLGGGSFRGQAWVIVRPDLLVELLTWLRDEPDLSLDLLMDIGGVDLLHLPPEQRVHPHRFEVVYQLMSLRHNHRFRVKVAVDDGEPVPTVFPMWGIANWMEREVYDMFGVPFEGHPNLRRILCHEEFVGHALRKDYPIQRRQRLSRPVEIILCDDPEHA